MWKGGVGGVWRRAGRPDGADGAERGLARAWRGVRAIASKFGRHNSPRRAPKRGGGHPQGVPLPIVFSRRFALRRAPTRGAPTDCLLSAFCPAKGTHKGRPYGWLMRGRAHRGGGHPQGAPLPIVFSRRSALGRAPTRGAPTDCLLSAFGPGKGTHKGRPYGWLMRGRAHRGGGHPQGAPLPDSGSLTRFFLI